MQLYSKKNIETIKKLFRLVVYTFTIGVVIIFLRFLSIGAADGASFFRVLLLVFISIYIKKYTK